MDARDTVIGEAMLVGRDMVAIAQAMPIGAVRLAVTLEAGSAATLQVGTAVAATSAAEAPSTVGEAGSMVEAVADSTAVEAALMEAVAATAAATGNFNQVI